MEGQVKSAFLAYSMSVLTSRALPDVRDGMKPGQRRILYAMYEDNLTSSNSFRKSATTVGNVLGRYHPHGDAAVYGTMVRMAQTFSYRYPLVQGQGNFGSIDGDPPAAYRYTESRLAKISDELMRDIEKNVVDMAQNFDYTRTEPTVLPSRFPNLLVNGTVGIAVGMATNIPPHNLGEIVDGTIYYMENPEATVDELMQFIKGPDFPTAGIIYGLSGIRNAYETGKGRIMIRAKADVNEDKRRIIITEIPYMVNKSALIESMADQVKEKRIDGVTAIRDESDKKGIRIVVEYRKDVNGQIILNQFYKLTKLQDTFAVNMIALVNGVPRTLTLTQIIKNYVDFQEEVIERRTRFDLEKAQKEEHIYNGYKIAVDNIDEVIDIIRNSTDVAGAKQNLMIRFDLSEEQAQAIVSMTLGRLSGMERAKIENKLAELRATIAELSAILADKSKIIEIIKEDLLEIKRKYGDDRKTVIVESHDDIDIEDLIERHECVITTTNAGYIKRQPSSTYTAQHRGGRGRTGMKTKEEDFIESVIVTNSHSILLFFTNFGKVFAKKAYQIPEAGPNAKGTNIVNLLEISENEKITTVIEIPEFRDDEYLVMVTKYGVIKRTPLSEYSYQRRGGKIAINLDEGDELIFVSRTDGNCDVLIATRNGLGARFSEGRVSVVGRTARGVRGIKLKGDDFVVGAALIVNTEEWQEKYKLVTITENGFGKRTEASQFDAKGRGTQGVICHNISDKTGLLCGIKVVSDDKDLLLITDTGIMIKTPVDDVPIYGRGAAGVKIIKLVDDAKVVHFAYTEKLSDKDEDAEGEEAETAELGADNAQAEPGATLEVAGAPAASEPFDRESAPYVGEGIDKLLEAAEREAEENEAE
ncbi:MAG: DNA gyrase subunit A [Clostridia bacterium]|nr:DNA gyrase subunit A [Clostridia bacterium]